MQSTLELITQIFKIFKNRCWTLSVAESCTGGLMSHYLSNQDGSSCFFNGGIVAYSPQIKMQILQVPANAVKNNQAVNQEVAKYMANSVKSLLNTDWSLSITGSLGQHEPEKGRIFVGLSGPQIKEVQTTVVKGLNRDELKNQATKFSFDFLLSKL